MVAVELDRVRLVTRALPRQVDPQGTIGGKLVAIEFGSVGARQHIPVVVEKVALV